jgi:hypothetical protein
MAERAQGTGTVQLVAEPGGAWVTLLDRNAELTSVEELIGDASGRGRPLASEGPPGIAKASLLREARALGQEAGIEVLGACGSELERTFSFGVARQLIEPLLAQVSDRKRGELLSGAARLAVPHFEPPRIAAEERPDIPLPAPHGLYWLTQTWPHAASCCSSLTTCNGATCLT